MKDQASSGNELLMQRLALVEEISALNAEALKLSQTLAGVHFDLQRCNFAIERLGENEELAQELHDAEENAAEIEAAITDCDQRLARMEDRIAEIDSTIEVRTKDGRM